MHFAFWTIFLKCFACGGWKQTYTSIWFGISNLRVHQVDTWVQIILILVWSVYVNLSSYERYEKFTIHYPRRYLWMVRYLNAIAKFLHYNLSYEKHNRTKRHMPNFVRHTTLVETLIDIFPNSDWCTKYSPSYERSLGRTRNINKTYVKQLKSFQMKKHSNYISCSDSDYIRR